MSSNYSVSLEGPAPWGFRLQGGKDFNMPLTISRLTDGGKAAKANIAVGDLVLSIDGIATEGMTHLEAQNKIKACTGNLSLTLQKAPSLPKPAAVPKEEPSEILKPVPLAHPPHPTDPPSTAAAVPAYNKSARPFGRGLGGGEVAKPPTWAPPVASIPSASSAFTPAACTHPPPSRSPPHHPSTATAARPSPGRAPVPPPPSKVTPAGPPPPSIPVAPQPSVYNTPINLYSNDNACEVAMGQRRALLDDQGETLQLNGVPRRPIIETDIGFYHIPTHSDASRKRIMEDTEDWRPRTGTSQSRSFRILAQMTGTENEPKQEADTGKQTNEEAEEPQVNTHGTCAVKTMVKGPVGFTRNTNSATTQGLGNKGRVQVGLITPTFGGPRSSPMGPVVDRPVPQPHPKDEDSLVQRAEHFPAGTRTPVCALCDKVIRGPFLVAMGKSWHPEEFNCTHCRTSLADIGFVEEQGSVYCEHCYEEFFAPTCGRCQGKILGEVINALKQTWHVYCFLCASCQQPIRNNTFHLEDGEPYCERDYYNLFGTSCHGCDFPIEAGDKFLEALGFTWHDTCFVCAVCCTSLESQTFFSKKDKLLCKKHAHTVKI